MSNQIDIPLKDAILAWDHDNPGKIKVITEHSDNGELPCTTLAVFTCWRLMTDLQRMEALLDEAWRVCIQNNISPRTVHNQLLTIPEYRNYYANPKFPYNP